MSVKTDDTPYELKIKAKFDGDIDTHTISAVSIYNPDYIPQSGVSLGVNHKCAAGGFRILPITDAQFEFSDSNAILKAPVPEPITDVIVEHP